jgi:hypothetical protein
MTDARADALSLLATPQLGTFLTPDQREVVLRALADVETLKRRVESAEAQLQAIRTALNGNPGVPAPKEAPQPPAAPPPTVQAAGGSPDDLCKCGHMQKEHAAGETYCRGDGEAGGECNCLKFQPRAESQSEPCVRLSDEGKALLTEKEGDAPLYVWRDGTCHADKERDAGVAPPRWGRVRDPGAAWHLWLEDAGEAECGEATDAEIEFLPEGQGMDPDVVCLDWLGHAASRLNALDRKEWVLQQTEE